MAKEVTFFLSFCRSREGGVKKYNFFLFFRGKRGSKLDISC